MGKLIVFNPKYLRLKDEASQELDKAIETSENLQKALSFGLVYDYANEAWVRPISDTDGRLLVSTSPTKASNAPISSPALALASFLVLAANPNRKAVMIQNESGNDVYITFSDSNATVNDFLLKSGVIFIDDVYLGEINGIALVASGNLTVVEYY